MPEAEFHFNCVNRSKICRRIMYLNEEKEKHKDSNHMWTEKELYDQMIGELQDLIY